MNVKSMFQREREMEQVSVPIPQNRRQWSARAAEVEDYVERLEADVVRFQQESQSWERAASLAEGERDRLRAELTQQCETARRELAEEKIERQRVETLIIALDAKFSMLAAPIVQAMEEIRGSALRYAPRPEQMRALAGAIEEPVDEQVRLDAAVPEFILRGPAIAS